jgi:hypothetical protein
VEAGTVVKASNALVLSKPYCIAFNKLVLKSSIFFKFVGVKAKQLHCQTIL